MSELYERLKKFENQEIGIQKLEDNGEFLKSIPVSEKVRLICVSPEMVSIRDESTNNANNELHWLMSEIKGYKIVKDFMTIILR